MSEALRLAAEREAAQNRLLFLNMRNIWNMPQEELLRLRAQVMEAERDVHLATIAVRSYITREV